MLIRIGYFTSFISSEIKYFQLNSIIGNEEERSQFIKLQSYEKIQ